MKLLILQLSDVHCTDENIEHNVRIDKIGSALRSIGNVDKVILCFSGDLSASGSTTEINSGRAFINKVIIAMSKSLKCGHIETYLVITIFQFPKADIVRRIFYLGTGMRKLNPNSER